MEDLSDKKRERRRRNRGAPIRGLLMMMIGIMNKMKKSRVLVSQVLSQPRMIIESGAASLVWWRGRNILFLFLSGGKPDSTTRTRSAVIWWDWNPIIIIIIIILFWWSCCLSQPEGFSGMKRWGSRNERIECCLSEATIQPIGLTLLWGLDSAHAAANNNHADDSDHFCRRQHSSLQIRCCWSAFFADSFWF